MSRDMAQSATLIHDRAQLVTHFRRGEKPAHERGFGTEHEKLVMRRDGGGLLSFEEPGGFADLFAELADRGWEPSFDQHKIAALTRDGAALTLEPGGQFELSGAITNTVFETASELDDHFAQVRDIAGDRLLFVCWGMNPFDEPADIPWMPKSRYQIMRDYLPTRADLPHWMMKMTCTVQANFDYTSERDAVEMIRVGLGVSPIVSALFANSPIKHGEPTEFQSYRCHIWTRTDPDRTGFPDFMLRSDWSYEDYLEYVLDVPMFFIRRDGHYVDLSGQSFRKFIDQGLGEYRATMGDFELHLSTIFPELRMKQYIEVRGADAGRRDYLLALPAVWKGIFYDDQARAEADALIEASDAEAHRRFLDQATREALSAQTEHGPMKQLAQELLAISRAGLDRIAEREGHESESPFLDVLDRSAERGETQADVLRRDYEECGGDRLELVKRWALIAP